MSCVFFILVLSIFKMNVIVVFSRENENVFLFFFSLFSKWMWSRENGSDYKSEYIRPINPELHSNSVWENNMTIDFVNCHPCTDPFFSFQHDTFFLFSLYESDGIANDLLGNPYTSRLSLHGLACVWILNEHWSIHSEDWIWEYILYVCSQKFYVSLTLSI